jgi:hypothetical protein
MRQEAELASGGLGEPLGGPRLVPDDLDGGGVDLRQLADPLGDQADEVGGERAPAGGSSSSTRAWPPSTVTERTSPMSTTDRPFSWQQGS